MGSMRRRLCALEEIRRERAAEEIRRAWLALTDEEIATLVAPHYFGRPATREEREHEASFRTSVPDSLIAAAVGYREDMKEEELSGRIAGLLAPVLDRSRAGVRRTLESREDGP